MARFRAVRLSVLIVMVLVVSHLVSVDPTVAATAEGTPVTPDPALCTVEPRPEVDFENVLTVTPAPIVNQQGTPVATPPLPPPDGVPADAALQKEITDTLITFTACTNASDLRRVSSFMTDDFFRFFFGGTTAEHLAVMENTPPIPADKRAAVDVNPEVEVLPDGHVVARVQSADSSGYFIFEKVGDRWLIDFFNSFPINGTPTP